jgi:RNA polymerase sigma-70 factor (ECF subfamily)
MGSGWVSARNSGGDQICRQRPLGRSVLGQPLLLGSTAASAPLAKVDEARLRAIVDANFDTLWRFLRRLGVAEADVDDAVQEVILVLTRKLDSVEIGRERSFVLSIAFRVASDARRRTRRRREVDSEQLVELPSISADPEASAQNQQMRAVFAQVLEQLSLDLRAVFVLYELEDFTMAEIAQSLQLPPGTVASRLRRAREAFEGLAVRALATRGLP